MTPERWRQINDLFHAVVERDPAARGQLLDETAAGDPALAAEVRSLLAAHDSNAGLLEEPVWAVAPTLILDDAVLHPGAHTGPYRIIRELGRGGMGVVYEAEDTRLQRLVALKSLPARYTDDPIRRERLVREARAAAALSHPAIATVYALEELDGALYLVSEFVRGQTLREELRAGPLPPARLMPTLLEIASGLAAAHAAGIVHRDLKPENIVRCLDGRVKILDFGLAHMTGADAVTSLRLTQAGMAVGTPGYMAPEQLEGRDVDERADVFSFGVLACELAAGVHPFGASPGELLARMADLLNGRPVSAIHAGLPVPGLDGIVRRCLRRDPSERYRSAEYVLADLDRLAAGPAPAPEAPIRAGAGHPMWWWQVHQIAVSIVVASMPVASWFLRELGGSVGSKLFLAVLALSTISVTIRLNMLFTARVNRPHLAAHRARVYTPMAAAEALLGLLLLAGAALVAGPHDALAAVLVTLAVATVASLGLIEPTTTAAALEADNEEIRRQASS